MKTLLTNAIIHGETQNLLINNGLIAYLGGAMPPADKVVDLAGKNVIPAMIDPHTHIRDLGQTEKEDWLSASKASLNGGVSMVFDMPNNRPPTINLKNLNLKRQVAKKALVRYKFNIAATSYNLDDVREMLDEDAGDVASLKLFLAGSNSNEYENDQEVIQQIFEIALEYDLPVMVHSEWQECVTKYSQKIKNPTVLDHNFMRNRECAILSTEIILKIAKAVGNKLYIAHTSVAEEIDLIRAYKPTTRVFCEVTPHHLLINDSILAKAGNYGKINPPLRTARDNEAIWQGIFDGTVDTIGSDHAPHRLSEKDMPYLHAPSGFPGLETSLPLLLQEVKQGNLLIDRLVELTSGKTADIFGLEKMGKLAVGFKADLAIFDLSQTATVVANKFETKAKYSPFEGMSVVPIWGTIVNGELRKMNSLLS